MFLNLYKEGRDKKIADFRVGMKLRNRKRTKTPVGKNLRHSLHLVKQERGGRNRTAGILSWQETERGSEGLDFQSDACITFLVKSLDTKMRELISKKESIRSCQR